MSCGEGHGELAAGTPTEYVTLPHGICRFRGCRQIESGPEPGDGRPRQARHQPVNYYI
jgi:hypothetical protein